MYSPFIHVGRLGSVGVFQNLIDTFNSPYLAGFVSVILE